MDQSLVRLEESFLCAISKKAHKGRGNMSSKSLHWTICAVVAIATTGSVFIWKLPACFGCLNVQVLLWLRLFLRSKYQIVLCLMVMLLILGALWYSAAHEPFLCPFDISTELPSCQHISSQILAGLPFAAWGFWGTMGLFLWMLFGID